MKKNVPKGIYFLSRILFKTMLMLKLIIVIVFFTAFQVQANNASGQAISLSLKNTDVKNVLIEIEKSTSYRFLYNYELMGLKSQLDFTIHKASLKETLDKLLEGNNLTYKKLNKNLIAIVSTIEAEKKQIPITGTITDIEGKPIPGVSVKEKGTNNGAVTNTKGQYKIEVGDGAVLVFSAIGFLQQEKIIDGNQTTIDVILAASVSDLDEVVVVGYGTQKKINLTGAVSTISGTELTTVPTANTANALAGKLPGLVVRQGSGRPGSDGPSITVRGFGANTSSGVQGEGPLVIVDGIQRSFSQIDPNEIESISVLKDASAAVYGIQSSAGVILVTTKRGTSGKPVISLNSTYSLQQNTALSKLANFQEHFNALANGDAGDQDELISNLQGRITPERLEALQNGTIPGTDWLGAVIRDYSPFQQHNINVRGGGDRVRYFGSLGYSNQSSIWKSGDFPFKRYNARLNLDATINKYLSVNMDFAYRKEDEERFVTDSESDFSQISLSNSGFPASLPNGAIPVSNAVLANYNPIAVTTKSISGFDATSYDVFTGNLGAKFKLPFYTQIESFVNLGIDRTFQFRKVLYTPYNPYYYDGENYTEIVSTRRSEVSQSQTNRQSITTQLGLRYNEDFDKHSISSVFLMESRSTKSAYFTAYRKDLLSTSIPYLFIGDPGSQTNNGYNSNFGRLGYVGRINYAYDSKYLLELSGRYDGSPYFPKETRFGFFSGVSAGWLISKESFFNKESFVNNLKLRMSYAQLGNDNANSYDYIEGFSVVTGNGGYVINGNYIPSLQTLGIPNKRITWQRSNTYNLALEAEFFEGKLGAVLDVFYRKRFNLLKKDDVTLPSVTGADVPLSNIESRDNRGLEFSVFYRNNFNNGSFKTTANVSWNREKYLDYVESVTFENADQERINRRSGQWVNRTFGYVFDGFFNTQEEIDNAYIDYSGVNGNGNIRPGDIRLKDINGDSLINSNDQVVIGRGRTPEIIFGWNTQIKWKSFDLEFFFQGAANFNIGVSGGARDVDSRVPFKYVANNIWTPEKGNSAEFPARGSGITNKGSIDKYLLDGSYVRLRNLVIGYNLKPKVLSKIGFTNARFTLSGTNLLLFDKMGVYDFDPEVGTPSEYPIQRVFTLGMNLSF